MNLRDIARVYTERKGWACIPCEPRGKQAIVRWKTYQQRVPDDRELDTFFGGAHAERNLAVITGEVSDRLLVVDFDRTDLFVEWWKKVFRRNTLAVTTGKGVHLYFRLADGAEPVACGKFHVFDQPAGDIRYNGGYVLAPPSIHPNGTRYTWIEAPHLEVTFADLHLERPVAIPSVAAQSGDCPRLPVPPSANNEVNQPRAYAEAALTRECDKVRGTPERGGTYEGRNKQLYISAVKLAKYLDILGRPAIHTALAAAAVACGLHPLEASRTVNSGLTRAFVRSV
jgi:hypothetical protein